MIDFETVFILSPHTDDGELGAGGTISRLVRNGSKVHYLAFSAPSLMLKNEVGEALKSFKTEDNGVNLHLYNLERRIFPKSRQHILQILYDMDKEYNPDLVITPSTYDLHQDHETITNEAKRVFKKSTIFGYILRWNCQTVKEDVVIPISKDNLNDKIRALGSYHSQINKKYFDPSFHINEAKVRGFNQGGYAESFEMIRLILPV
jgi:LmbE family N-acetylglucosaminyl deacetylase